MQRCDVHTGRDSEFRVIPDRYLKNVTGADEMTSHELLLRPQSQRAPSSSYPAPSRIHPVPLPAERLLFFPKRSFFFYTFIFLTQEATPS
jgi:hypothetical protein